jgi:hypothetical protein
LNGLPNPSPDLSVKVQVFKADGTLEAEVELIGAGNSVDVGVGQGGKIKINDVDPAPNTDLATGTYDRL